MEKRLENHEYAEYGDVTRIACDGDMEIEGVLVVGDTHKTFEYGPLFCGGTLIGIGSTVNAGVVHVGEDFIVKTANLEELNVCGDVVAEYLWCECGAYVLGDVNVGELVSEVWPVYIGGTFTGKFKGDSSLLHEHFTDWENL